MGHLGGGVGLDRGDGDGIVENFGGGADAELFSGGEDENAVAHAAGLLGVVGDEDAGEFAFADDFQDELLDVGFGVGVEGAGGFIEQEDFGTIGEGSGDADTLGLSAGEARGVAAGVAGEADLGEEFFDLGRGEGEAMGAGAEGEVVGDGSGEEVGGLEDKADAAAQVAGGEGVDVGAVEEDAAGGGLVEAVEEAEEGAFAGAGGAHDGEDFVGGDGEGEGVDDGAAGDDAGEGLGLEDGVHGASVAEKGGRATGWASGMGDGLSTDFSDF
jgi:hypothetical protein